MVQRKRVNVGGLVCYSLKGGRTAIAWLGKATSNEELAFKPELAFKTWLGDNREAASVVTNVSSWSRCTRSPHQRFCGTLQTFHVSTQETGIFFPAEILHPVFLANAREFGSTCELLRKVIARAFRVYEPGRPGRG